MRTPKNTNYFLLLILIFISAARLNAQIERAVSSTTILKPPYSLYLSDYGAASSDKCAVTLVFKDFNEPSWNVYMSLTIESMYVKFETSPNFRPSAPITLSPGTPVTLTGSDLYEYFRLENLVMQGINRSELEKFGHIPEGLYKFTFNVRDYTSGKIISTATSFTANIQLADPPRVLSPKEGDVVLPKTPQLMTFQWQIQNCDPASTEYKLHLFEIIDTSYAPKTSIANNQVRKIFESDPVNYTTFVYDASAVPLEQGKIYAYYIQAINIDGKTICRNDGKSETSWFSYGYPQNGQIAINGPRNEHGFTLREDWIFSWETPNNLTFGQKYKYKLKFTEIADTANPKGDLDEFTPFTEYTTSELSYPLTYNFNYKGYQKPIFSSQTRYAWQVKAYSGAENTEIAKSKVNVITGPPCLEAFKAGNHTIFVTKNKKGCDYNHFSGEGKVLISNDGKYHVVYFKDIKLERNGAELFLKRGQCGAPFESGPMKLTPEIQANGNAYFYPDSIILDSESMFVKGKVKLDLPYATDSPEKPVLVSENVTFRYNDYLLLGSVTLNSETSYALLEPSGFRIDFSKESKIYLRGQNSYGLELKGNVFLPEGTANKTNINVAFKECNQLYYLRGDTAQSSAFQPVSNAGISIEPYQYIIDLSNTESPGIFASNPQWKGVFYTKFDVRCTNEIDDNQQVVLDNENLTKFDYTLNNGYYCYYTSIGLTLKSESNLNSGNGFFNTFPAKINTLKLSIENSSVKESYLTGSIKIPIISTSTDYDFTVPIKSYGFALGNLTNPLENTTFTFNPESSEQKIAFTINRAVFLDRERLQMNVTMNWSHLGIEMKSIEGFTIWGNYNLGFYSPNGNTPLPSQLQGSVNSYRINIDYVGSGRQGNVYAIGVSAKIVMGEDVGGGNGAPATNIYSMLENSMLEGVLAQSESGYINPEVQQTAGTISSVSEADNSKQIESYNKLKSIDESLADLQNQASAIIDNTPTEAAFPVTVQDSVKKSSSTINEQYMLTPEEKAEIARRTANTIEKYTKSIDLDALTRPVALKFDSIVDNSINKATTEGQKLIDKLAEKIRQNFKDPDIAEAVGDFTGETLSDLLTAFKTNLQNYIDTAVTLKIKNYPSNVIKNQAGLVMVKVCQEIITSGVKDVTMNGVVDAAKDAFTFEVFWKGNTRINVNLNVVYETTFNKDQIISILTANFIEAVGNYAANKYVGSAVEDWANKAGNTAAGTAAAIVAKNVKFDFSNLGDKLKNGRIDQIIKFDPCYIVIPSPVATITGYVKFTKDDPVWGDSWQANLGAKIKVPFPFEINAQYINGTAGKAPEDFKYWFVELEAKGLNILLSPLPIYFTGAGGKVYNHMQKDSGTFVYKPSKDIKYGAGMKVYFMDAIGNGMLTMFDLGLEMAVTDEGAILEFYGNIIGGNLIKDKIVVASLLTGSGFVQIKTHEKQIMGCFKADMDNPIICAHVQVDFLANPSKWYLNVGEKANPIKLDLLCTGRPVFEGYFNINPGGTSLWARTNLGLNLATPWIGLSGVARFKAYCCIGYEMGVSTNIDFKPKFKIVDASIWAELYADLGIKYETLLGNGDLKLLCAKAGGILAYTSEPNSKVTGTLYASIQVLEWKKSTSFDVSMNL